MRLIANTNPQRNSGWRLNISNLPYMGMIDVQMFTVFAKTVDFPEESIETKETRDVNRITIEYMDNDNVGLNSINIGFIINEGMENYYTLKNIFKNIKKGLDSEDFDILKKSFISKVSFDILDNQGRKCSEWSFSKCYLKTLSGIQLSQLDASQLMFTLTLLYVDDTLVKNEKIMDHENITSGDLTSYYDVKNISLADGVPITEWVDTVGTRNLISTNPLSHPEKSNKLVWFDGDNALHGDGPLLFNGSIGRILSMSGNFPADAGIIYEESISTGVKLSINVIGFSMYVKIRDSIGYALKTCSFAPTSKIVIFVKGSEIKILVDRFLVFEYELMDDVNEVATSFNIGNFSHFGLASIAVIENVDERDAYAIAES